jgi:hypothetical protein
MNETEIQSETKQTQLPLASASSSTEADSAKSESSKKPKSYEQTDPDMEHIMAHMPKDIREKIWQKSMTTELEAVTESRRKAGMRALGLGDQDPETLTKDQQVMLDQILDHLEKDRLLTPEEEATYRALLRPCMANAFERAVGLIAAGGVPDTAAALKNLKAEFDTLGSLLSDSTGDLSRASAKTRGECLIAFALILDLRLRQGV